MPTHILATTLQAAVLSGLSNLTAQYIKCRRESRPLSVNARALLIFVVFTILTVPPNVLWQEYLEAKFPGKTTAGELDKPNTFRKVLFDQTIGAFVNTVVFVGGMAVLKGKNWKNVKRDVQRDVFQLMINGWKLWPGVAIFNFTFVPVSHRVIVGSVVGLFWGVYLSLFASLD